MPMLDFKSKRGELKSIAKPSPYLTKVNSLWLDINFDGSQISVAYKTLYIINTDIQS